jgi:hypothetical protein
MECSGPVVQITHDGTVVRATAEDVARAREHFSEKAYFRFAEFLHPALLGSLLDELDRTPFYHRVHDGIGTELCAASGLVSGTLELVLNDLALLQLVSTIIGHEPIGCLEGRIYRMVPGTDHHDSWHSDVGEGRLAALSLNLSRLPPEGGSLQIQRAGSSEVLDEVNNRIAGDAIIFRIDPGLRHRVLPVVGIAPRTAYAGWFRSAPDFRDLMLARLASGQQQTGSA